MIKFCPIAKEACEEGLLGGLLCEQWDPDRKGCQHTLYYGGLMLLHEAYMKSLDVQQKVQSGFLENQRREELVTKLNLELLKRVPNLSEEEKAAIDQAWGSRDNDKAERLLRQAGLIGGTDESQQAKRCAEKIAGQVLTDNLDRVGGLAEEMVGQNHDYRPVPGDHQTSDKEEVTTMRWFCKHKWREVNRQFGGRQASTDEFTIEQACATLWPKTLITYQCDTCNKYRQKILSGHIKSLEQEFRDLTKGRS